MHSNKIRSTTLMDQSSMPKDKGQRYSSRHKCRTKNEGLWNTERTALTDIQHARTEESLDNFCSPLKYGHNYPHRVHKINNPKKEISTSSTKKQSTSLYNHDKSTPQSRSASTSPPSVPRSVDCAYFCTRFPKRWPYSMPFPNLTICFLHSPESAFKVMTHMYISFS